MKILIVEPGHKPRPAEIDGTVEAMREIVGGKIQAMYLSEDIALVFNNDPDMPLPPQNRGVRNDIIRGVFFLCGAPEDGNYFVSLTDEQLRHYMEAFALPEVFLDLGGRTIILPCRKEGSFDRES
ncbi:MAG: DUF3846 domain-containing protein [Oscillibacter sp.]|nr:DUF3846 domain-containing protein [Oscillibacter sp.]